MAPPDVVGVNFVTNLKGGGVVPPSVVGVKLQGGGILLGSATPVQSLVSLPEAAASSRMCFKRFSTQSRSLSFVHALKAPVTYSFKEGDKESVSVELCCGGVPPV